MIIELFGAYRNVNCDGRYLEWYRSGHNEHDWKSCGRVERPEGSNPSHSAIKSYRYRCVWRKARRINRFHVLEKVFRKYRTPEDLARELEMTREYRN